MPSRTKKTSSRTKKTSSRTEKTSSRTKKTSSSRAKNESSIVHKSRWNLICLSNRRTEENVVNEKLRLYRTKLKRKSSFGRCSGIVCGILSLHYIFMDFHPECGKFTLTTVGLPTTEINLLVKCHFSKHLSCGFKRCDSKIRPGSSFGQSFTHLAITYFYGFRFFLNILKNIVQISVQIFWKLIYRVFYQNNKQETPASFNNKIAFFLLSPCSILNSNNKKKLHHY